jgi:Putative restriction endonuclease
MLEGPTMSSRNILPKVPPLQSGDRLNRLEFERRYQAHPSNDKFELIEGVVYMSSPVRHGYHASPHFDLITWLGFYRSMTPAIEGGDNGTLKLDMDNEPQGDAYLIILPANGGNVKIDQDEYIVGGPELVAEVAGSTVSIDATVKKRVYEANGVREYILWRVYDDKIDWFTVRNGDYHELTTTDGILRSEVLAGLWLDPTALIEGNMTRVLSVLQQGIASAEHAAFVARLQQQGPQP